MRGLLERRFGVLSRTAVSGPRTGRAAAACPGALGDGAFRGLSPGHHADSRLDANGHPERRDFVWNVAEHVMPRILPPFGFSSVRLRRFVAHARILRANGSALSSCEGHAGEEAVLGAGPRAEVPHRLATNESVRRKIAEPALFDVFRVAVLFASGGLQLDFGKAGGAKLPVQRGQIPSLRWRGSGVGAIDFAVEPADLRRGAAHGCRGRAAARAGAAEERGDMLLRSRNGFGGRSGNA